MLLVIHNGGPCEYQRLLMHLALNDIFALFSMVTIVAAAVKSGPWQGSDGIITEGASLTSNNDGVGFKGMKSCFYHGDIEYLYIS
jgi:hypothetical protein